MDNIFTGKPLKRRSSLWPSVRKKHLLNEPLCQWCHGIEHLEVHHIKPYHEFPELELDSGNFITLCDIPIWKRWLKKLCFMVTASDHLAKGHLGNYKKFNPDIREECVEKWSQLQ